MKDLLELTLSMLILFVIVLIMSLYFGCYTAKANTLYVSDNLCEEEYISSNQEIHTKLFDHYRVQRDIRTPILDAVYEASEEFGIAPDLLMSIIAVESSFNPNVVSHKGAIGLMQVMPTVWGDKLKEYKIITEDADLYKINNNIMAGSYVLHTYLKQGSTKYTNEHAIVKYALFRYFGIAQNYTVNSDYYHKILSILGLYHLYRGAIDTSFYIK